MLERRSGGSLAAGIQHVEPVFARDVDDGEQVAAKPDIHRLNQGEYRRRCHRGVDGVASVPKDLQPGLGGKRLAGGDDAVLGHDLRASLR